MLKPVFVMKKNKEVYLEPCQTPEMELFCEYSWRLKAVKCFCKKFHLRWVLNKLSIELCHFVCFRFSLGFLKNKTTISLQENVSSSYVHCHEYLRPNSYVEVIPHRIKLRWEKFLKFELNATLMPCMNPNKI